MLALCYASLLLCQHTYLMQAYLLCSNSGKVKVLSNLTALKISNCILDEGSSYEIDTIVACRTLNYTTPTLQLDTFCQKIMLYSANYESREL